MHGPPISNADWLDHLRAHLPLAREGVDPEGVHQVRVACGRLNVWLRMAGHSVLRDDLHWVRSSAARARDLDIFLGRPWEEAVQARFSAERRAEQNRLRAVFASPRLQGLLRALPLLPPLDGGRAREILPALRRRALRRAEGIRPGAAESLHAFRRALRQVRYAVEWTGGACDEVHAALDAFGLANDLASMARHLEEAGESAAGLRQESGAAEAEALSRLPALRLQLEGDLLPCNSP